MTLEALLIRKLSEHEPDITDRVKYFFNYSFVEIFDEVYPNAKEQYNEFMRGEIILSYHRSNYYEFLLYHYNGQILTTCGYNEGCPEITDEKEKKAAVIKALIGEPKNYAVFNYPVILKKIKELSDEEKGLEIEDCNIYYSNENFYADEEIITEENLLYLIVEDFWYGSDRVSIDSFIEDCICDVEIE